MKMFITFGSSNLKCKEQRTCEIFHFRENVLAKSVKLTLRRNLEARPNRHRNFLMPIFPGNASRDLSFD